MDRLMEANNNHILEGVTRVVENQGSAELHSNRRHLVTRWRRGLFMAILMVLGTGGGAGFLAIQNAELLEIATDHFAYLEMTSEEKLKMLNQQIELLGGQDAIDEMALVKAQNEWLWKVLHCEECETHSGNSMTYKQRLLVKIGIELDEPDYFKGLPSFIHWSEPDPLIVAMIDHNSVQCIDWVLNQSDWYSCLSVKTYEYFCDWVDNVRKHGGKPPFVQTN